MYIRLGMFVLNTLQKSWRVHFEYIAKKLTEFWDARCYTFGSNSYFLTLFAAIANKSSNKQNGLVRCWLESYMVLLTINRMILLREKVE